MAGGRHSAERATPGRAGDTRALAVSECAILQPDMCGTRTGREGGMRALDRISELWRREAALPYVGGDHVLVVVVRVY